MLNVIHLDAKEVSSYFYYSALKILVKPKCFLLRGVKIVDISGSENTSFYLADVCIWIYLSSVSCTHTCISLDGYAHTHMQKIVQVNIVYFGIFF